MYNKFEHVLLYPFFLLFLFIVLPKTVFAAVVINEILPNPSGPSSEETEWIELYNSGSDAVNLYEWSLDDIEGGSTQYSIASGSSIPSEGFLVFEKLITGIALNNTEDTVRLINAGGEIVDSYSYRNSTQDISFGRSSDGGGSWTICTNRTKGTDNSCPLSTPTPTPTPTVTPSKTPTPTPTNTPNPSPTKTLIAVIPTAILTRIPTKAPTALVADEILSGSSESGDIAGVSIKPTPTVLVEGSTHQKTVLPVVSSLLFVGIGLALLSGVLVWKKRHALTENPLREN